MLVSAMTLAYNFSKLQVHLGGLVWVSGTTIMNVCDSHNGL